MALQRRTTFGSNYNFLFKIVINPQSNITQINSAIWTDGAGNLTTDLSG